MLRSTWCVTSYAQFSLQSFRKRLSEPNGAVGPNITSSVNDVGCLRVLQRVP